MRGVGSYEVRGHPPNISLPRSCFVAGAFHSTDHGICNSVVSKYNSHATQLNRFSHQVRYGVEIVWLSVKLQADGNNKLLRTFMKKDFASSRLIGNQSMVSTAIHRFPCKSALCLTG
jgi:hypothetical protein